jgi:hypothetical protein
MTGKGMTEKGKVREELCWGSVIIMVETYSCDVLDLILKIVISSLVFKCIYHRF